VFTFHPIDDAAAHVLGFEYALYQHLVGIRQQEVGARQRHAVARPQRVNELIQVARRGEFRVAVQMLAKNPGRLAVEIQGGVGVAPDPVGAHLVRAA
jgi:hypothetical protein